MLTKSKMLISTITYLHIVNRNCSRKGVAQFVCHHYFITVSYLLLTIYSESSILEVNELFEGIMTTAVMCDDMHQIIRDLLLRTTQLNMRRRLRLTSKNDLSKLMVLSDLPHEMYLSNCTCDCTLHPSKWACYITSR